MTAESAPWGKLIALEKKADGNFEDKSALNLFKTEITIGRHEDCDVPHCNNKLLSGFHCKISFCKDDKRVTLLDTSKNGTLVNCKKVKMTEIQLSDGDIIHCAHKKTEPDLYVVYRIEIPVQDVRSELNDNEDAENETQLYDSGSENTEDYFVSLKKSTKKRTAELTSIESDSKRIQRSESCNSECHPKSSQDQENAKSDYDAEMEQNLTCSICQDIFHDCVSLQPCMHSFCGACFSEWMVQSDVCPTCRTKGNKVAKNHIVNNLVAAFLSKHPDRKRSDEELKSMDLKNKIKNKVVNVNTDGCESASFSEGNSHDSFDMYGSSNDSDSDNDDANSGLIFPAPSTFLRPPGSKCRQCPNSVLPALPTADSQGSTVNQFICSINQNHFFCCCCQEQFPDRSNETLNTQNAACASGRSDNGQKVQCTSCSRLFCHLYWGCKKFGCLGCLNKFKDFNFGRSSLINLLNTNSFETDILLKYLDEKKITILTFLHQCIAKLDSKEYIIPSRPNLNGDDILCYSCGIKYFGQLAYQYRSSLSAGELPAYVTQRSNCYWGQNCRTQKHNASHASRFNHICDQTRF